jgi:hypothetical protein
MDRISDSGSDDLGSSPNGITDKETFLSLFFINVVDALIYNYMSEKFTNDVLKGHID